MVQKPTIIDKTPSTISKYIAGGIRTKTTKIAWHYTGVHDAKGINTINNWFNSINRGYIQNGRYLYASAHFVCDLDGKLYSYVPMNRIAYTTNSANVYSIGVECATTGTDDHYSDAEYVSMVKLGAWLGQYYKLDPRIDFIRHTDVVGRAYKLCPKYFVDHEDKWEQFKLDCYNYMIGKLKEENIKNCTNGKGNSIIDNTNTSERPAQTETKEEYKLGVYEITTDVLNIRKGSSTAYSKIGTLKKGEQITITKVENNWGYVESKDGWISLAYTKFIEETFKPYIVKVNCDALNGRKQPTTNSDIVCKVNKGTPVTIVAKKGKWLKTKVGYYIYEDYTDFVRYV